MFWISSQTGTREPKTLCAFPSLLRRGLVLKPIIITCMATLLTIEMLLVILTFVSIQLVDTDQSLLWLFGLVKFELKSLNVALCSIVESREYWQIICILRISGSMLRISFKPWCWEHCSWYLLFVLWEYPWKWLCRIRTEGSSHVVGV